MTYSPGRYSESACTRALAASRVCAAFTKCSSPASSTSPRVLRMQKGRRIHTPKWGTNYQEGQCRDYRINPVRWVWVTRLTRARTKSRVLRTMDICARVVRLSVVVLAFEGVLFGYPI